MSTQTDTTPMLEEDELSRAIEVLERIVENRGVLAGVSDEQRARLFQAAGRVAHPGRTARRQLNQVRKQERRRELATMKAADERLLARTALRSRAQQPLQISCDAAAPRAPMVQKLLVPRNCYICKTDYREVDPFYDSLCPECAALNWRKRHQTADLSGRVALVTGGRVKIGFQTALKLLRAGASVVVTTRFPHDATDRFCLSTTRGYGSIACKCTGWICDTFPAWKRLPTIWRRPCPVWTLCSITRAKPCASRPGSMLT